MSVAAGIEGDKIWICVAPGDENNEVLSAADKEVLAQQRGVTSLQRIQRKPEQTKAEEE